MLSACGGSTAPPAQRLPPRAADFAKQGDATERTVSAAKALLATLDEVQRARLEFPFGGDQRSNWSNFPSPIYARNGLRIGSLSASQREAVMTLLGAALSRQGFQKVREIMDGDEALKTSDAGHMGPRGPHAGAPPVGLPEGDMPSARSSGDPSMEPMGGGPPVGPPGGHGDGPPGGMGPSFGHDEYYIAFLGSPSLRDPWMLQFGGHHLAINLTIVGEDEAMTPSLPCTQPASYTLEGQTVRPLGREHDKSLALIRSLDDSQKAKAILVYQVSDLVLGPGQDGRTIAPEGIPASQLGDAQRRMLLDLVHEWVGIVNDDAARVKMQEIEGHLADTWFAWSGPTTGETPAYFRVQGPTLFIEYAPQRSRGAGALDGDHIHTIYRDPTNDYGARLLKR